MVFSSIVKGKADLNDEILSENFYHTVNLFIQLLGAEQVSKTDMFFRISRAAIGSYVDYSEIQRILARITSFDRWYDAWKTSAVRFSEIAEAAEAAGHLVTAGENYLRAGLLYHFGQLFTRPEDANRSEGQRKRVFYYRKACPYLNPPIEPVDILFEGYTLPAYLCLPTGVKTPPIVLMIPGANSVKEELHHWGQKFIERGLATLVFDGPGQGERSLRNGGLALHLETFHHSVSAVLDHLENRSDVDAKRRVCWGQSTGGQLAMRAAAHDHRIKLAVSLGGGYDFRLEIKPTTPADVWEEARDLYGLSSFIEAEAYVKQYGSMQGIIEKVRCPLLIVHGGRDNIVAMEEVEKLKKEAGGPVSTLIFEDGNHSVCNRNLEMSAAMADWVVDQLVALDKS